jgi:1,4-alpha-glucan branching enzyme
LKAAIATDPQIQALAAARVHDPHAVLGQLRDGRGYRLRAMRPAAEALWVRAGGGFEPMQRVHESGVFEWRSPVALPAPVLLKAREHGREVEFFDPYSFAPAIAADDLYLFNEGTHYEAYRMLGSHAQTREGVAGVRFAVWAPNAERVSVIGDFNGWDGRLHPMAVHGSSGVWELFIPGVERGTLYKYEIRSRASGELLVKTDPYAQGFELRPGTAARAAAAPGRAWSDQRWMQARAAWDWLHAPINVYELHPGSWRRHPDGRMYTWRELAAALLPYVRERGFTHIELMPVSEHPLDESWGYQTTGYFAATARYGSPDDLREFIDACHGAGIGVLLDWVPAHFPNDAWALAHFDGTALYEHEDPRKGFHQDWGTHIFNYGRNEVRSFLLSSANYWLSEFHVDGLRVDAVASMLYLDYSRQPGQWLPNKFGGRENLEAIDFLRQMNVMVHREFPGALTAAEESTAWPMVSRPTYVGGLGFSLKWNMGWMNDTLRYFARDPIYRRFHHNELTFVQIYAYSENFMLPLSHDEVVHGKGALLAKMPGDAWQQFANLRLLFTYQYTTPGKKLNFMGNELAQGREWRVDSELDWGLLQIDWHRGVQLCLDDLSRLYRDLTALHDNDFESAGFDWVDCHDTDQSVLVYERRARDGSFVIAALNFTPQVRRGYRIGVSQPGAYREIFNSDSQYYGGSNVGNGELWAENAPWMGRQYSISITIPPLAGVLLQRAGP